MISDITGVEIRCPKSGEAAAFGAALQALAAMENRSVSEVAEEHLSFDEDKRAFPDEERHRKYMEAYEKWKVYCGTLTPIFK